MQTVYNTTPLVQPDGSGGHASVTFPFTHTAAYGEGTGGASAEVDITPTSGKAIQLHSVVWAADTASSTPGDSGISIEANTTNYYFTLINAGPGFLPLNVSYPVDQAVHVERFGLGASSVLVTYSEV